MRIIPPNNWALVSLHRARNMIDLQPRYQRGPVWKRQQKQLLIDSVLRGMDIPKIYLRRVNRPPVEYEAIDGHQRIRAIWEFYDGAFELSSEYSDDLGCGGKRFSELPFQLSQKIDTYNLTLVVVEEARDDEIDDMFLRLNFGTTLTPAEKRNAIYGEMRDFVKELPKHAFFTKVSFENHRFAYDEVAAQCLLLEMSGGPTSISHQALTRMYRQNRKFDTKSPVATKVRQYLSYLDRSFDHQTPELDKRRVVSLYLLVSALSRNLVLRSREPQLKDFFLAFEAERRQNRKKSVPDQDQELLKYDQAMSRRTGHKDSLEKRLDVLASRFLVAVPDIESLDPQRNFSPEQRIVIYRRDGEACRLCSAKVDFNEMVADHRIPWAKGGKTSVENGQLLCKSCNFKKGNKV